MAWFLAEQAVSDLSRLSREEFEKRYEANKQADGSFLFRHEPARRDKHEEADHDKRGGLFSLW